MPDRLAGILGLCRRAGRLELGHDAVTDAVGAANGTYSTTAPAASAGIAGRRSSPSRSRHTTGRARSLFKTVTTAHRCPPATH